MTERLYDKTLSTLKYILVNHHPNYSTNGPDHPSTKEQTEELTPSFHPFLYGDFILFFVQKDLFGKYEKIF